MPKGLRFSVALVVGSSYKNGLKMPPHLYTLAILLQRKTIRFEALYLVLLNGIFRFSRRRTRSVLQVKRQILTSLNES